MKVIKDGSVIEDNWSMLAADAPLPAQGDVLVGLSRWSTEAIEIRAREGKTGVFVQSSDSADAIGELADAPLVAIEFPKFADGRGYSLARLLRERLGYNGEIRAVGEVLHDQVAYMGRCGFNSFVLKPGKDVEGALSAFTDFSVSYQGAADDARPLFRRVQR